MPSIPRQRPFCDEPTTVLCPLHAAAPALLEALEVGLTALERIALIVPREQMLGVEAKLRAAIKQAKGA